MKTMMKNISLLLCVIAAMVACERKPLTDDCLCTTKLSIPVSVDWTTCGVTPKNVTILFYNSEDGRLAQEDRFEHNSYAIQHYAALSAGRYTAVVFNELRNQIDYMTCRGHEHLSTLKFEGNDDDPLRSRTETRSYIKQSGDLAVAVVEGIVVTEEMIVEAAHDIHNHNDETKAEAYSPQTKATVESLMNVVPLKKNTIINISAHVKNIYYARMPALVDLVNLSDGYYVYGDKNSDVSSTLQFTMNNRKYDEGSFYDGTIRTTITTFGTMTDRASTSGHDTKPVMLDLLFKQVDEAQTEVSRDMDVTSDIKHTLQPDGSYLITIDVSFSEPLPPVEPETSGGDSGFGAEVEDWEDVDVPLDQK